MDNSGTPSVGSRENSSPGNTPSQAAVEQLKQRKIRRQNCSFQRLNVHLLDLVWKWSERDVMPPALCGSREFFHGIFLGDLLCPRLLGPLGWALVVHEFKGIRSGP